MKIFSKFLTVNISKLNFWLLICIAKNFIWTTLKVIFSIFRFFAPSDSRFTNSCISAKICPIITNHTSMDILFTQLSDDVLISISKNWPLWLVLCSWVTYVLRTEEIEISICTYSSRKRLTGVREAGKYISTISCSNDKTEQRMSSTKWIN